MASLAGKISGFSGRNVDSSEAGILVSSGRIAAPQALFMDPQPEVVALLRQEFRRLKHEFWLSGGIVAP